MKSQRVPCGVWGTLLASWMVLLLSVSSTHVMAQTRPTTLRPITLACPALPAVTLDGKRLDLAVQPGWRVIYFWAGECPCVRACERHSFVPLARKYKGLISFYAVAANRFDLDVPRAQIRSSITAHHLPFPVLLDPHHKVAHALGAVVTPQAFLLNPQGRVIFSGIPDDSRRYLDRTGQSGVTHSYLSQSIQEALAGKPVTQPQVKDEGCMIAW